MKTNKIKLYIHIVTLVFLVSCNQDHVGPNSNVVVSKLELEGADHKSQVIYTEFHLGEMGKSIASLGRNQVFRSFLYQQIEKKFDGEYEVLIKDLSTQSKTNLSGRLANNEITLLSSLDESLNAFLSIDNENYYPQVYIPFYDELVLQEKIGIENPVLVFMADDRNVLEGYKLNDNNQLAKLNYGITEEFAKVHEIWVISINERVNNEGTFIASVELETSKQGGRIQGVSYPNAKINPMMITVNKESWAAGASEVNIKRLLSFYQFDQFSSSIPHGKTVGSNDDFSDGKGTEIAEYSTGDIDTHKNRNINWTYVPDWPAKTINIDGFSYHTDYLYYVIFEYDAFPTGKRDYILEDASGLEWTNMEYRSADGPYSKGYIPEYAANGWYYNSGGGIQFSSTY